LVVAASIAGETLGCVDFPAVVIFLGRGEDVDEAFLLGEAVVLCGLRVGFSGATAVVQLFNGQKDDRCKVDGMGRRTARMIAGFSATLAGT